MPAASKTQSILLSLVFLMLVATALRFFEIDKHALWMDEAYSLWFSRQTLKDLWTVIPTFEPHPPLYYTLLHGWSIFGGSETALRSLSAIVGIATVPVIYVLGRIVCGPRDGRWVGFGAALILAASPIHVQFGQEARSYAFLAFAVAVTLCGAAWLLRHPTAACLPLFGLPARFSSKAPETVGPSPVCAWMTLIAGMALTLWIHNISPVFIASLALSFLVCLAWRLNWNRWFFANGLLAGATTLLLWAPALPILFRQLSNVVTQYWMKAPSPTQIAGAFYFLFGSKYSWPIEQYKTQGISFGDIGSIELIGAGVWFLAHAIVAMLGVLGLWMIGRRHGWQVATFLATVMVLPIAITLIVTFTARPVFAPKTLIWVSLPFYIAVAASVLFVSRPWLRALILVGLFTVFLQGSLGFYEVFKREPWNHIAAMVAKDSKPEDVILLVPNAVEHPFGYYFRRHAPDAPVHGLPQPFPAIGMPNPYPAGIAAVPAITEADMPIVDELLQSYPSGWLILRAGDLFDPTGLVLKTLAESRTVSQKFASEDGNLNVYRFD